MTVSLNQTSPPFPSLYIPTGSLSQGNFLYSTQDVWRFTVFWTCILYGAFHLAASGYAAFVQPRNWKLMCVVTGLYLAIGAAEALLAGSVVGLILGTVYGAGGFRTSTWIPLVWAVTNVLVLTLSSFSMQGGL